MSDRQEELRDDAGPTEDDDKWQMGEPPGWDENEPSPHEGEEGQQESEA
jgi:hypothetical protein